jgi:hypothetical protein
MPAASPIDIISAMGNITSVYGCYYMYCNHKSSLMMYQQKKLGASDDGKSELYSLFNAKPPPHNRIRVST